QGRRPVQCPRRSCDRCPVNVCVWSCKHSRFWKSPGCTEAAVLRHLPIAWLQLSHGRTKLLVALAGVLVADLLMWMQLGLLDSVLVSATTMHRHLRGDLIIVSRQTQSLTMLESFSRRELTRSLAHPGVVDAQPLYLASARWRNPWTGQKRPIFVYGMAGSTPL